MVSITVISVYKYFTALREKYVIQDSLYQAQAKLEVLIKEKQNLLRQLEKEKEIAAGLYVTNGNLKDNLGASQRRLRRAFKEFSGIQKELGDVKAKISVLKTENKVLIENRQKLVKENQEFKSKFGSIAELKKLIRQLRNKRQDLLESTPGNRGFLIKDGRPTTAPAKVKIEVVPAKAK